MKICELVAEGHIEVRYVATAENASDLLTKPLAKDLFDKHRATLGFTVIVRLHNRRHVRRRARARFMLGEHFPKFIAVLVNDEIT